MNNGLHKDARKLTAILKMDPENLCRKQAKK